MALLNATVVCSDFKHIPIYSLYCHRFPNEISTCLYWNPALPGADASLPAGPELDVRRRFRTLPFESSAKHVVINQHSPSPNPNMYKHLLVH